MEMTVSAYAKHRGVSRRAVYDALSDGRIVKNANGKIDPVAADASWAESTGVGYGTQPGEKRGKSSQPKKPKATTTTEPGETYAASRARREAANARLAELRLAEEQGQVLRLEAAQDAWFNILRSLRDRLLSIPDRCSAEAAALTEQAAVRTLIDTEIRNALREVSDDAPRR